MSRLTSIAVFVLLSAGVAWGQAPGEVVSYHGVVESGQAIGTTPPDGFVLTDIAVSQLAAYGVSENAITKVWVRMDSATTNVYSYHFNSGIPFAGNETLTIEHTHGAAAHVTIAGYVPCPDSCSKAGIIPAVGNPGLGVLVLLLLAGGAAVIRRRQRPLAT